jgi:lipopolysaccharide transport protein LptA
MGDIFSSSTGDSTEKQSGATNITANSMDINLEGDRISLFGNVIVDDKETNIAADKIIVYLTDVKSTTGETKKEAKQLIAIGNVIIIKKLDSEDGEDKPEEKATAGKADYDLKTGLIVLTEDPVLFQGPSYIKGDKITLFRNSDRVKVEGNQSMGQASKLLYNPNKPEEFTEEKDIEYTDEGSQKSKTNKNLQSVEQPGEQFYSSKKPETYVEEKVIEYKQ